MSNAVYPSAVKGVTFTRLRTAEFSTLVQKSPNATELRIAQSQNPIWHWQLIYDYLKNYIDTLSTFNPYTDFQELLGFYLARQGQFDDFLFTDPDDNTVTNGTLQLVSDTSGAITAAAIGGSAGSGFAVNDQLAVTGGGGSGAVLKVATLSGSAIASFSIVSGGTGYSTTSGVNLVVISGSGSGSPTANITVSPIYYSPIQRNMGGLFYEDIPDLNGSITNLKANAVAKTIGTCGGQDAELHGPGLSIPGYAFMGMYLKWCAAPTPPITATFSYYFRVRFESDQQDFEKFSRNLFTIGGSEGRNGSGTLKLVTSRPNISI